MRIPTLAHRECSARPWKFGGRVDGAWFGAPDGQLVQQQAALHAALSLEGRDPRSMIRIVGMMVRDPNTSLGADDGEAFRG